MDEVASFRTNRFQIFDRVEPSLRDQLRVEGGWWMVDGGWSMVAGGCWLVLKVREGKKNQ